MRLFVSIVIAIVLSGCIDLASPASAPSQVAASQGTEEDRVIISWTAVPGAGVYFVYRADSIEAEYTFLGSTGQTTHVDTTMLPEVHYWYAVSAADNFGRPESEIRSDPVEGWSIHTFAWTAATVAFNGEQFSLVADAHNPGTALVAWAEAVDEGAIDVSRFSEGEWLGIGGSFGIVDGAITGALSISSLMGVPVVAYRDESVGGKLTAAQLLEDPDGDEWVPLGSAAGQTSVPVRAITSIGLAEALYVVALDDTIPADTAPASALIGRRFTASGGWEVLPALPVPATGLGSNPKLVSSGSTVALAYEEDSTATLRFFTYDTVWDALLTPFAVPEGNIPDGYMDFAVDSTTGTYVFAYSDGVSESLYVYTYNGVIWSDVSPSVTADPNAGSVGVAADRDTIYLFYRDLTESRGIVTAFDGGAWTILPQDAEQAGITGQFNLSSLNLAAQGNIIFAAAKENNSINADVYD